MDLFTALFTTIIMMIHAGITNQYSFYKLPKQSKIELTINAFEKEITTIKQSLDFINEYIDSI